MSQTTSKTIELCQQLVRRPSLTPDDGGCQNIISTRLDDLGFETEQMKIGEVSNLWATRGDGGPLFCFAGHTDVVPTGDPETWSTDPYSGEIKDGLLFGRGSADMKGALAAMVSADAISIRRMHRSWICYIGIYRLAQGHNVVRACQIRKGPCLFHPESTC